MSTPIIYGFPPSTYTQSALMTAHELGIDVELRPLEFKQASHLKLHPYGKMPVLEYDGVHLFETLAIARYLDAALGGSKLTPDDAADEARMLQWCSVAIDYAYEDLVNGLHADEPGAEAVTAAGEQVALLDAALTGSGKHLVGDRVTLADLLLFPMVEFAAGKLDAKSFSGLTSLTRWRQAMAKRPSASKVV